MKTIKQLEKEIEEIKKYHKKFSDKQMQSPYEYYDREGNKLLPILKTTLKQTKEFEKLIEDLWNNNVRTKGNSYVNNEDFMILTESKFKELLSKIRGDGK